MSEEEKKAIKWFDTERKLVEITNGDNNYFSIILNLIDKLQKENKILQENNLSYQEELAKAWKENENINWYYENKIGDKIKELNKNIDLQWASTNYNEIEVYKYQYAIEILKELLGDDE